MKFIYVLLFSMFASATHAGVTLSCTEVDKATKVPFNENNIHTIKMNSYFLVGGLKQILDCYSDCTGKYPGTEYNPKKMIKQEKGYLFTNDSNLILIYSKHSLQIENALYENSLAGKPGRGYVETTYVDGNLLDQTGSSSKLYICVNNIK